jgi:hypothetical protein
MSRRRRFAARQRSFLKILPDLATPGQAQFLIATHWPIVLSDPGFGRNRCSPTDFLNRPETFFKRLFGTVDDGGDA